MLPSPYAICGCATPLDSQHPHPRGVVVYFWTGRTHAFHKTVTIPVPDVSLSKFSGPLVAVHSSRAVALQPPGPCTSQASLKASVPCHLRHRPSGPCQFIGQQHVNIVVIVLNWPEGVFRPDDREAGGCGVANKQVATLAVPGLVT